MCRLLKKGSFRKPRLLMNFTFKEKSEKDGHGVCLKNIVNSHGSTRIVKKT